MIQPNRKWKPASLGGAESATGTPRGIRQLALAVVQVLRPHQWLKNTLLFVPLIMAKKEHDPQSLVLAILAFCAFCWTASAVYVLNDLVDLGSDRAHPVKRLRPFASGALPWSAGYLLVPLLVIGGAGIGLLVSYTFVGLLVGYWACNLAYSFLFKRLPIMDVLVLSGFYCLRIFAGALAINVDVSEWLLAFSLFFFFSLALAKRVSELKLTAARAVAGRGYREDDLALLTVFGSCSGYLSVLVYALFINSAHVQAFYRHPQFLWLIFPLLLYWTSRIWLVANRGELHSDPLVFALRDRLSYLSAAVGLLAIFLARTSLF